MHDRLIWLFDVFAALGGYFIAETGLIYPVQPFWGRCAMVLVGYVIFHRHLSFALKNWD